MEQLVPLWGTPAAGATTTTCQRTGRDKNMSARESAKDIGQRAVAERAQSIAASGRHEVAWKLYVEHKLKPPVRFYETKRHPSKASALKRALAIYRNPGWRLNVLFI